VNRIVYVSTDIVLLGGGHAHVDIVRRSRNARYRASA